MHDKCVQNKDKVLQKKKTHTRSANTKQVSTRSAQDVADQLKQTCARPS